jgi:hypothetical protein
MARLSMNFSPRPLSKLNIPHADLPHS